MILLHFYFTIIAKVLDYALKKALFIFSTISLLSQDTSLRDVRASSGIERIGNSNKVLCYD